MSRRKSIFPVSFVPLPFLGVGREKAIVVVVRMEMRKCQGRKTNLKGDNTLLTAFPPTRKKNPFYRPPGETGTLKDIFGRRQIARAKIGHLASNTRTRTARRWFNYEPKLLWGEGGRKPRRRINNQQYSRVAAKRNLSLRYCHFTLPPPFGQHPHSRSISIGGRSLAAEGSFAVEYVSSGRSRVHTM